MHDSVAAEVADARGSTAAVVGFYLASTTAAVARNPVTVIALFCAYNAAVSANSSDTGFAGASPPWLNETVLIAAVSIVIISVIALFSEVRLYYSIFSRV